MISSLLGLILFAWSAPEVFFDEQDCSRCHSGVIAGNIDNNLWIEDPENNFEEVETYIEGKTYRIRVLFDNPILANGSYRVAFSLGAFRQGQVAGTFSNLPDPGASGSLFYGSSSRGWLAVRRHTPTLASAATVSFDWIAPAHGRDVTFFLVRVEANGNSANSGDRGSARESLLLRGPNGDDDSVDPPSPAAGNGGAGDVSIDSGSDLDPAEIRKGPSRYGVDFASGCSLVLNQRDRVSVWIFLVGLLMTFFFRIQKSRCQKNPR